MNHYLIEFRFQGYAKKYLKRVIFDVGKRFNVKGVTRNHVVPHITLFGPFNTNSEKKVVNALLSVCENYNLMSFKLKGFGNFENRVVFVDVLPSDELKKFRKELASKLIGLRNFFVLKAIKTKGITDFSDHHAFHATIAFKDIARKFYPILRYLKRKRNPSIGQKLLRITLLKNGKILYEYDFLQKKLLTRNESLNKDVWKKTEDLLKI